MRRLDFRSSGGTQPMLPHHCDRNPPSSMTPHPSSLFNPLSEVGMHLVDRSWDQRLLGLSEWLHGKGISPARTVVLVPYAQLMITARQAWARAHPNGFAPRFESSRNWAANLIQQNLGQGHQDAGQVN